MVHPGQQDMMGNGLSRGWRMMSSYLRAAWSGRWHEKCIAREWVQVHPCITNASRTVHALRSRQKARISFELHGCVTWKKMPLTALEPLDRSWQPAQSVVLDDLRLQVDRVEHRSLAGCSLHNLGSGQQVAAGARWRGGSARIESANGLSCSERATMCTALASWSAG